MTMTHLEYSFVILFSWGFEPGALFLIADLLAWRLLGFFNQPLQDLINLLELLAVLGFHLLDLFHNLLAVVGQFGCSSTKVFMIWIFTAMALSLPNTLESIRMPYSVKQNGG